MAAHVFFHVSAAEFSDSDAFPTYQHRTLVTSATPKQARARAAALAQAIAAAGHRVDVREADPAWPFTSPARHLFTVAGTGPTVTLWMER